MSNNSNLGLAISLLVIGLLVGGLFTYVAIPREVTKEIKVPVEKLVVQEKVVGNLTDIASDVNSIKNSVNEDEDWKTEAFALATAEWSDKDNKAIFKVLTDIDEREDITSIVVTDEIIKNSDVEDEDGKVTQYLTVRYENSEGDNAKEHLKVVTVIEDGEVESQEIEFD